MRPILVLSLLLAVLLCTPACTWSRSKINTENFVTKAEKVQPGKTTVGQLPGIFGTQPFNWFEAPDGKRVYSYTYGDSKTNGLVLILFNFIKTNTAIDTAFFIADGKSKNAVVVEKYVGTNSEDVPWAWYPFGG